MPLALNPAELNPAEQILLQRTDLANDAGELQPQHLDSQQVRRSQVAAAAVAGRPLTSSVSLRICFSMRPSSYSKSMGNMTCIHIRKGVYMTTAVETSPLHSSSPRLRSVLSQKLVLKTNGWILNATLFGTSSALESHANAKATINPTNIAIADVGMPRAESQRFLTVVTKEPAHFSQAMYG